MDTHNSVKTSSSLGTEHKWEKRYLEIAKDVASWSKDPSRKIGAVIVGDKGQIIGTGYNGFPRGIFDFEDRYNDRQTKYKFVVHAEANCLYNAAYSGSNISGSTIYVTGLPVCHECAKAIIQCGIKRVVMDSKPDETWKESTVLAQMMFDEAGVEWEIIDESL